MDKKKGVNLIINVFIYMLNSFEVKLIGYDWILGSKHTHKHDCAKRTLLHVHDFNNLGLPSSSQLAFFTNYILYLFYWIPNLIIT